MNLGQDAWTHGDFIRAEAICVLASESDERLEAGEADASIPSPRKSPPRPADATTL